ncbi:NUDIX hydrolase [Tumebacillus flagellatus]|uniref:NUDIX hydrolase n=1 Tax=Tumebacillus flagellatus TaxID=1157490 RepID=A0A074LRD6_9BACL|nr:NUDIX domain-containing protein [Tumebacillus flagellatus]KEO82403.1 NUDIX hydrolase [Tumebacillus flagellatus]
MSERFTMPVAVHLFFVRDREILLLRRWNTGYEDGNYSVPAGHLDGGEEVVTAAIREAREECGVEIAPSDVQVVGVMHRKANDERIDFFVTVARWDGEIVNAEPQKCDDLSWHGLDALPENVIPYVRRAIDNYRERSWFESYGWECSE